MNDTPIIEGEDLLRIYSEVNSYTGKYACLNYDMDTVSPTGEMVHFIKGTLVQIYPYMENEPVEDDKWNGFHGAYMGQHYNVLHSISIKAYYNNSVEKYVIWTWQRPIRNELNAHMSCMQGLDFLRNVFRQDEWVNVLGRHLDGYLYDDEGVGNLQSRSGNTDTKKALKITSHVFGGTLGIVFLGIAFLIIGIFSTALKMLGCMALFFVIVPLCILKLSKNDGATQALIEESERCNRKCINQFDIISNLHGGEPFS